MQMKDKLFTILQAEVIRILKFSIKNKDGAWAHPQLNKEYFFRWARNRIHTIEDYKHMSEYQVSTHITYKIDQIFEWVELHYKSKEWRKLQNAKYYQNAKCQHNRKKCKKILSSKEANKITAKIRAKKITDRSFLKVRGAYDKCIEAHIEPTIAQCVKICGLSKNTVQKYLKIIKINNYISGDL